MVTIYNTTFNSFEILDGGDNMILVLGSIVRSFEDAKKVCDFYEAKRLKSLRKAQKEIWYCGLAA